MRFSVHFSVVSQRKEVELGRRVTLDVIRSKPGLEKKKKNLTLDQRKHNKIWQNLDGIAIFPTTKKSVPIERSA